MFSRTRDEAEQMAFPGVGDGVDKFGKGDVIGGVGSTLGGVRYT